MKKFYKVFGAMLLSMSVVFTGCSGINGIASVSYDDETPYRVSISVPEMGIGSASSAKTIFPGEWGDLDTADSAASKLEFYITGKATRVPAKHNIARKSFTEELKKGAPQIELFYDSYELTLEAEKDGEVVLSGTTFIDMTNGGTEVEFVLKSTKDVKGSVDITVNYESDTSKVSKIVAGIYDIRTGAVITDAENASSEIEITDSTEIKKDTFKFAKDILPGTYLFAVKFLSVNDKICGYYSDIILIDAGNTSSETITIDNLEQIPAAPANFKASLVTDSENKDDGYYYVKFEWEDKSDNEENFIINIKEYSSVEDATGTTYAILGAKENEDEKKYLYTKEDFYVNPADQEGSLLPGNKSFVVKLPFGRLFDATIQSNNFVGSSDEVSRVNVDGNGSYQAADKINRFEIEYNLDGGKYLESASNAVTSFVEYASYTDVASYSGLLSKTDEIIANNEAGTNYPQVKKDKFTFDKWVWANKTPVEEVTHKENNFENVTVKANFISDYKANISVSFPDYTEAKGETVELGFEEDFDLTNVAPGSEIVCKIKESDKEKYELYIVTVDGNPVCYKGTTTEYTISGDYMYRMGNHEIVVGAKLKGKDQYVTNHYTFRIAQ